jgi:hypothetical protein
LVGINQLAHRPQTKASTLTISQSSTLHCGGHNDDTAIVENLMLAS